MRALVGLALVLLLLAGACGGSSGPPPPECGDGGCACASGEACAFSVDTCSEGDGGGCSLACTNRTRCGGFCLDGCAVECAGGATCTVAVGAGATVSCTGAATTCHVRCSASCTVSCQAAECDLACGDEASHNIPNGGKCL